jgi:hypothetical protein
MNQLDVPEQFLYEAMEDEDESVQIEESKKDVKEKIERYIG